MELKRLKELKELYERPTEQELGKEQEELLNEINYVLQLHIPVVVRQSEQLKCDKVCDWESIGYQGNGHQECKTCGKQKAF